MKNFIELTKDEGEKVLVNLDNIVLIQPNEEGSILLCNFLGKSEYPFRIYVKEPYSFFLPHKSGTDI